MELQVCYSRMREGGGIMVCHSLSHIPTSVNTKRGYAYYDCCMLSSPAFACMLHFDLVSILFGTSIPTFFNILVKMFLHYILYPLPPPSLSFR